MLSRVRKKVSGGPAFCVSAADEEGRSVSDGFRGHEAKASGTTGRIAVALMWLDAAETGRQRRINFYVEADVMLANTCIRYERISQCSRNESASTGQHP